MPLKSHFLDTSTGILLEPVRRVCDSNYVLLKEREKFRIGRLILSSGDSANALIQREHEPER